MTQANNSVTVTPGVGETIATQAAGGKEYQVVVLADQNGDMDPLQATLTGGTQKTKLVDTGGTNVASISAAGAVKVDGSAVTQPVSGTVTANAGTGTFTTKGYGPATADILSGSITLSNSTTATTIITIPANRTWVGSIGLEAANTGGANAAFEFAWVMVTGTNATPATGTKLVQVISHKAGTTSVNFDAYTSLTYVTAPVGNSVTLQVQMDNSAATFGVVAFCNGVLL